MESGVTLRCQTLRSLHWEAAQLHPLEQLYLPPQPLFFESLYKPASLMGTILFLCLKVCTLTKHPSSSAQSLAPDAFFPSPGQTFPRMGNIIPLKYKTIHIHELACRPEELKTLPYLCNFIYIILAECSTKANKPYSAFGGNKPAAWTSANLISLPT